MPKDAEIINTNNPRNPENNIVKKIRMNNIIMESLE